MPENIPQEQKIAKFAQQEADKQLLPIKILKVEAGDNQTLLVSFTAEERVDFRHLVDTIRKKFNQKIIMHQVGPRDKACQIGGLGPCGRPLCCTAFLRDFTSITTKMAKEQNLTPNLSSCSGLCGKLMCCLAFEIEGKRKPLPVGQSPVVPTAEQEKISPIEKNLIPPTHHRVIRELGKLHLRFKKK